MSLWEMIRNMVGLRKLWGCWAGGGVLGKVGWSGVGVLNDGRGGYFDVCCEDLVED